MNQKLKKFSYIYEKLAPVGSPSLKTEDVRLDHFLYESLVQELSTKKNAPVTKALVRKCIVAGAVYLNGRRVKIASKPLFNKAKVEIFLNLKLLEENHQKTHRKFELLNSHILYRDEHFLAVHKPAGVPTQPTLDDSRENVFDAVKRFLKKENAGAYVGLHHRLDRDTSGVLLFTLTKEANPFLANQFQENKIKKTYHALCYCSDIEKTEYLKQWKPVHSWTIQNFLGEKKSPGKRKTYTQVRSGGKPAETHFELVKIYKKGLLIQAQPKTGRTHQIRVHLSEFGLPIFGEYVYAHKSEQRVQAPRLMLHASLLEFQDMNDSRKTIQIHAPLPPDFKKFELLL